MRALAASLAAVAALAAAAPASGAAFEAPRTLTDWGPGGELLAAAPGVAAWTHPTGVRLASTGQAPVRIPGDGRAQELDVAAGPVAGWVDSGRRLHAYAGRDQIVDGTMERVRDVSATPSGLAWIGIAGAERKLQIATRRPGGAFSDASTPAQAGRPAYGLSAAGAGGRSLLVWPAQDDGARRIQMLELGADGRPSAARWLTRGDHNATSAAVAMGPDGAAVVAWVDGMPLGRVTALTVAPDGTVGEPRALDTEGGGAPEVAVGPDGAAVVVWPAGGRLNAALRAPGATAFAAPETLPGENVIGWTASVTDRGETVVAWLDADPSADARRGARLSAAVAPPRGALAEPEVLDEHALTVAGAGDALTWVEGRPDGGDGIERRVRTTRLRGGDGGGDPAGPPAADHRAPRVKLRLLGVRGHRLRVRVRSDERAAVRVTLRRGGRVRGTLRAGRPRVLRVKLPARGRRAVLTVRATDAAGNATTLRRTVRLRR